MVDIDSGSRKRRLDGPSLLGSTLEEQKCPEHAQHNHWDDDEWNDRTTASFTRLGLCSLGAWSPPRVCHPYCFGRQPLGP